MEFIEKLEKNGPNHPEEITALEGHMFFVNDEPHCVWEWDLKRKNLEYIDKIDATYFEYLAFTHMEKLEGDNSMRAAVALRTAYHHGLETLFMMIFGAIQAPCCIVGWVHKCQTGQLRRLVKSVNQGSSTIFNKVGLEEVSWLALSDKINSIKIEEKEKLDAVKKSFADLWNQFAQDYLTDLNIKEYNSIKHGFRASSGGFSLFVGIEDEPGVPAPPHKMKSLGGSKHGTSFFIDEKINGSPMEKRNPHFQVRHCSVNWNVDAMIASLRLLSISINNIISFIKIYNGIDPKTVKFMYPQDDVLFKITQERPPVNNSYFGQVVLEKQIVRIKRKEIIKRLNTAVKKD